MSKINTRTAAGVQADHEFAELVTMVILVVAFIAVSMVVAAWVVDAGIILPNFGTDVLGM